MAAEKRKKNVWENFFGIFEWQLIQNPINKNSELS